MDYILNLIENHRVDFASMIIDCHALDHGHFNEGDSDLGFNKFIAHHLFRHALAMGRQSTLHCYYAGYSSKHNPSTIRDVCNSWSRRKWKDQRPYFAEVKHKPFRKDTAFFPSDVILGAIAKAWNAQISEGSPKHEIAEMIRTRMRLPTLAAPTTGTFGKLDIWEFSLSSRPMDLVA